MPTTSRLLLVTALAAAPASAQYLQVRMLRSIAGTQPIAGFGSTLATARDIDGDGGPELVVGEPQRDSVAFVDVGAASLVNPRTGAVLFRNEAIFAGSELGLGVAGLGDVDGDGVPDWAAGGPLALNGSGIARILSGRTGLILREFTGASYSHFGRAIADIGDLDGDGRAEFAISAPLNSNSVPYGVVRYYDLAGNVLNYVTGGSQTAIGRSLATIADVTGDGHVDLVIGEPDLSTAGQTHSGAVFVANPRMGGLSSVQWTCRTPFSANEEAGSVVAAIGDFDGDGMVDVATTTHSGHLYVLSGRNGAILLDVDSQFTDYGRSIAAIGDWNGDGLDDFAVGTPNYTWGFVDIYSCGTGSRIMRTYGPTGTDFGAAVAAVGDVDGDGLADVAVGEPGYVANGLQWGRVCVIGCEVPATSPAYGAGCPGAAGTPALSCTGAPILGGTASIAGTNLVPQLPGLWLQGWSRTAIGGTPLPLPLGAYGFPGCSLLTSAEANVFFFAGASQSVRSIPLPLQPGLLRLHLCVQACQVDAAAAGGLSFSNAIDLVLGNR